MRKLFLILAVLGCAAQANAAITVRTSSAGGGTSGTGARTSTIAAVAGDLLIVYVQWSTNAATNPTCTDNQSGTYDLIGTALNNASADIQAVFIRKMPVATTATITVAPVVGSGTNIAGEIVVIALQNPTHFGAAAVRSVSGTPQFGKQENQTTGVPTPVLPAAALTTNMTLMSVGSSTTAGSVPNASWTEQQDASQTSPVTSMEVSTRASGFTGTSAAYVSVASSVWNSTIIELDGSGFSHVQGKESVHTTSGTTVTVTLGAAPTTGNLVVACVMAGPNPGMVLSTVQDSNGNSYTITPSSPEGGQTVAQIVSLAYLLSAPANASATITATFSSGTNVSTWLRAEEFLPSGTVAFDSDAAANNASAATITTPSITPAAAGELLYAGASSGGTISGVGGTWIQDASGVDTSGLDAAYILNSASGATAVDFPQSTAGAWNSMAMAFRLANLTTTCAKRMALLGVGKCG